MAKKTKRKATSGKGIRKAVAHTFPPAGATLVGRYHGKEHRATIVEQDGRLQVRLRKDTYRSLSAAAQAITGSAINGWRFWTVV
jgi:Protein of unknown function (DUF2924)